MTDTVTVVTNIPRPYRTALFSVLQERLAADGLELSVTYTSDPAKHVRRGGVRSTESGTFPQTFVHSLEARLGYERIIGLPIGLGRALRRQGPCCVIAGGFGAGALLANRWCRRNGVPYVLWSGAWPGGESPVGRLERANRGRLVECSDSYVTYGTAAAEYLVSLGAQPDRISCAWNTVDLESIAAAAAQASAGREKLRDKYGLAAKNLLFVGSLVERKGLRELVQAALNVDAPGVDWALHLVGAGPLREELEAKVKSAGKDAFFRFHGLRPEDDVAELLGTASGFVLPTKREAWGLVINEAMACGVPVVVSRQAGATRDLIVDGVSGYVVEPTDLDSITSALALLIKGGAAVERVAKAGAQAVREEASLQKAAEGFAAGIGYAIEGHQRATR